MRCRRIGMEITIIASCAGKAAIDKWYGWKAEGDQNWRASKDYSDAFAAALKVSDGDEQAAALLVTWGERMADALVEAQWPSVHRLAFALLEKDQLNGEQIDKLLAVS